MREIYTARLESKLLLSARAQCYHFEFRFEGSAPSTLEPGQFLSLLAEDAAGKTYTRAYSIASAGESGGFALCVNRVEGGFFSNLLCDLAEGATLRCHGPHGLFTLRPPPAEALMIAAGTGIAPLRGFVQALFSENSPQSSPERSPVPQAWLFYEAPQPDELFYDREFRALASREPRFHYLPVEGGHGDHRRLEETLATLGEPGKSTAAGFPRYAYVCGLSELVKSARTALLALGWQKPQILFERYD